MATLIDVSAFRDRFDIDSEIKDPRLTPHVASASRRLRRWVGADAYADALAVTPTDAERKSELQNAEAHLAMHYALLGMQFAISSKGSVQTATASEGREIRRYLTPKEAGELATMYLDLAREIAEVYLANDGTPDAPFEFVDECD